MRRSREEGPEDVYLFIFFFSGYYYVEQCHRFTMLGKVSAAFGIPTPTYVCILCVRFTLSSFLRSSCALPLYLYDFAKLVNREKEEFPSISCWSKLTSYALCVIIIHQPNKLVSGTRISRGVSSSSLSSSPASGQRLQHIVGNNATRLQERPKKKNGNHNNNRLFSNSCFFSASRPELQYWL